MTTVTIIYKSGAKVHFSCESFTVNKNANGKLTVTWDTGKSKTRPMLIGVEDIAAVYEGQV